MEDFDEIAALMEESPVNDNHGTAILYREREVPGWDGIEFRNSMRLSTADNVYRDSTYSIPPGELSWHGLTAHRGVLSETESEMLDWEVVERMAEDRLGVGLDVVALCYKHNPKDRDKALRTLLDEKLLRIQEAGGNMSMLAVVFGWGIQPNGVCRQMQRALERARTKREEL